MRPKTTQVSPAYTRDEWNLFLKYTGLMVDLCNKTIVDGGFDGCTTRAFPCPQCARTVPSGVPTQLVKSEWAACPACIKARMLVGAIEKVIYGFAASAQKSKPSALEAQEVLDRAKAAQQKRPPLPPMRTDRMEKQIKIEEQRLHAMVDPDMRARQARLVAALQKAKQIAGGGA